MDDNGNVTGKNYMTSGTMSIGTKFAELSYQGYPIRMSVTAWNKFYANTKRTSPNSCSGGLNNARSYLYECKATSFITTEIVQISVQLKNVDYNDFTVTTPWDSY